MDRAKQKKYETEMIEFIRKHKIMRWSHIVWDSVPFSRPTAYNYELNKLDTIKGAFEENCSQAMNYLLQKWIKSDNPTLQIAAMRIVADADTHQKLNQSYIDHTSKGGAIDIKPIWIKPGEYKPADTD
jgi:hypothetical protein